MCSTHPPEKFVRDNYVVVAPFLLLHVVIAPQPKTLRPCDKLALSAHTGVKCLLICVGDASTHTHVREKNCSLYSW